MWTWIPCAFLSYWWILEGSQHIYLSSPQEFWEQSKSKTKVTDGVQAIIFITDHAAVREYGSYPQESKHFHTNPQI